MPSIDKEAGRDDKAGNTDPSTNEKLADEIQQTVKFKIRRLPSKFLAHFEIVKIVLLFLQSILIISNHVRYLGLWQSFTEASSGYRDAFNDTVYHKTGFLDFTKIHSLHLWRGWVIPSLLASSAYVVPALLCLRHELYHWKPDLLQHYLEKIEQTRIGKRVPESWLHTIFKLYESKHNQYMENKIQADRQHTALQDSQQFLKIVRVVALNIVIASFCVLALWLSLLQTKIDTRNNAPLPRSFVPGVQFVIWYTINDLFYFYPHWISHTTPTISHSLYNRVLPGKLATYLHKLFKSSHRLHHRTKANIGLAAWYCSPAEQIVFNLFPALLGPLATQVLADSLGLSHTWGTHLVTLYVWLSAAAASSVLAHSGYRSTWNDPGKHDLHHERAFHPTAAVNFGTLGLFDWLHGTKSSLPAEETKAWRAQRDRQAALWEASRRSGVPLTKEQRSTVQQPDHSLVWEEDKDS